MSTMTLPDRDLEQRMGALRRANEIRSCRSRLKRDVKAGRVQAADVITGPPEWAGTMKVMQLLVSAPGIGAARARKLLDRNGVPVTATLAQLTATQRTGLAMSVGRREPRSCSGNGGAWEPAMTLANTVRAERGKLHREVAALAHGEGRERVALLLENPPDCLASILVADLLMWADRVGACHARRMMRASRVAPGRTVSLTTVRQRTALAACLRGEIDRVRTEAEMREWAARAAA